MKIYYMHLEEGVVIFIYVNLFDINYIFENDLLFKFPIIIHIYYKLTCLMFIIGRYLLISFIYILNI